MKYILSDSHGTKYDKAESLKLFHRTNNEQERKERIFNARKRLIGLDLTAVGLQITDNATKRNIEAECERRREHLEQIQRMAVFNKSLEMEKRKRLLDGEINEFRRHHQAFDKRREFDLNDPDFLKRSLPARMADDDVRLGVSSAQIFSGEDLHHNERSRLQRTQQRIWLEKQINERKQIENDRLKADLILENSVACRNKKLRDMVESEMNVRKHLKDSVIEFNVRAAAQKKFEREQEKKEKCADDLADIYNMLCSDMLSENPEAAISLLDPKKKLAQSYRGMTPEELEKFRQDQYRQRVENEQRRNNQKLKKVQWEQCMLTMDQKLVQQQTLLQRQEKERVDGNAEYNKKLALEQKARNAARKETCRNSISDEFYQQFNKTTR